MAEMMYLCSFHEVFLALCLVYLNYYEGINAVYDSYLK